MLVMPGLGVMLGSANLLCAVVGEFERDAGGLGGVLGKAPITLAGGAGGRVDAGAVDGADLADGFPGEVVDPGEIRIAGITDPDGPVAGSPALIGTSGLGVGGHQMLEVDLAAVEVVAGR